jgi:hypothetical protein
MAIHDKTNEMNLLSRIKRVHPIVLWLLVFVLICLLAFVVLSIRSYVKSIPLVKKQQELAKEFGVNLDDFQYAFPSEYFYTVLKAGMSMSEVHRTVRGYEQVLHCGAGMEVYYYLTTDIKDTDRFYIFYDEQDKFKRLQTEDNDSRRVLPGGCVSGRLQE